MILYPIIICGGATLIATTTSFLRNEKFLSTLGFTWLAVVMVVLIDAIVAAVCRSLPESFADPERKIFAVSKKEKLFYERLKIRKWKDKIPEIGHLTGFRKNRLAEPNDPKYLHRFLLENCYGEIVHIVSVPCGFVILAFRRLTKTWISVALPVAIVNAILNILPIFVLRYNYYKLKILEKRRAVK